MMIGLRSTSLGELKSISTRPVQGLWPLPTHHSRSVSGNFSPGRQERSMLYPQSASVTLVLGGVRSGKSRLAQQIAEHAERVTFIATAERRDDHEMHAKIARHRSERPSGWITIEEPIQLAHAIREAGAESDVVLIDCLTLFASNLLEAYEEDPDGLETQIDDLLLALSQSPCSVVLVSNEVGSGVVPAYELGRRFRDLVGEINQRVASIAGTVLLMVAGLPFPLKGSVPNEVKP